jgi:membrane associated rhomboid family serine protease
MRRARTDVRQTFTFGGRLPAGLGLLLSLIVVASVVAWLRPGTAGLLALMPALVREGEIWRLVTWVFVQDSPITLLFVGIMLWQFGQQLLYLWGERAFLVRFLGVSLAIGVVTSLVGWALPGARIVHLNAWPTVEALFLAWLLYYPDQVVNYFFIRLDGRTSAIALVGLTVLWAVFAGPAHFVPHFAGLGIGWLLVRGRMPRWGRARQSWTDWQLKRRARHLKVVRKNGTDRPRWMN